MSYTVLARKYRPQKFSEVIGQEHVTRTLQNALEQGRTAHGYIFSGHRGIGKTTVARILAAALNCRSSLKTGDKPVAEPCGICESCTEIRAGNAVDEAATAVEALEQRRVREKASLDKLIKLIKGERKHGPVRAARRAVAAALYPAARGRRAYI